MDQSFSFQISVVVAPLSWSAPNAQAAFLRASGSGEFLSTRISGSMAEWPMLTRAAAASSPKVSFCRIRLGRYSAGLISLTSPSNSTRGSTATDAAECCCPSQYAAAAFCWALPPLSRAMWRVMASLVCWLPVPAEFEEPKPVRINWAAAKLRTKVAFLISLIRTKLLVERRLEGCSPDSPRQISCQSLDRTSNAQDIRL